MADVITVSSLWVYPVKAFRGIELESVTVGRYGFEGDREWQVVDAAGAYLTQRQLPEMALIRAEPMSGGLRLSTESAGTFEVARPTVANTEAPYSRGTTPAGDAGDAVASWLEGVLGQPCRLVAITEGYRRPLLLPAEPPGIEVSFADAAPVLIANTASLNDLVARATEPFTMDRFRPNLVVSTDEPWAEDRWRRARIGDCTIHLLLPWPRCAVPQVNQQTAVRHKEPAKVLRRHRWCTDASAFGDLAPSVVNKALFGVGVVAEPIGAVISVGDPMEIVEEAPPAIAPPAPHPSRPARSVN